MKVKINKEQINSFIISTFIVSNTISWFIPIGRPLIFVLLSLSIAYFFINKKIFVFNLNTFYIFFIYILFVFSLILLDSSDNSFNYLLSFTIFGSCGLIYSSSNIRIDLILKYIAVIGVVLSIPFLFLKIERGMDDYWGHLMGISYGVLPFILVYIYYIFNKISRIRLIFYIFSLFVYLRFLFFYGSRGTLGSIFLFCLLAALTLNKSLFNHKKLLFVLLMIISSVFLFSDLFVYTLYFSNDLLSTYDIKIYAIDKMLSYKNLDDMSNGRSDIYQMALSDLSNLSEILFGLGIGAFENKYNMGYIHNIIIQILYESGFLVLLMHIYILSKGLFFMLSQRVDKNSYIFMLFLFCVGFFPLFFSSTYWSSQVFWFLEGVILYLMFNKKVKFN